MQEADFDMRLKRAECPAKVAEIVEKTIRAVYPHYYPSGVVRFFLELQRRGCCQRQDLYSHQFPFR